MEDCRRLLEIHRMSYSRIYDATLKILQLTDPDMNEARGNLVLLEQKIKIIADIDKQLLSFLLGSDCTEEEIDSQMTVADDIVAGFNKLKFSVERLYDKRQALVAGNCCDTCSVHSNNSSQTKLKLPKIEFQKFGGEIKDWLYFWSQFKRIDGDETIHNEDKFQYLLQATLPRSRARQLIESYQPTAENYPKVIESLITARFGREDMLVEFYVRELLKLVLNNTNNKSRLSILFDKLESQLRALETLGVTREKCAAMLFPLVESCLPEEILRTWQRNPSCNTNSNSKCRLENMMEFLKREVENEERISLVVSGFEYSRKREANKGDKLATATDLVYQAREFKCVFCKGQHANQNCEAEKNMTLSEKKFLLSSKGSGHRCLKYGHISRRCGVKVECKQCKGRHDTLMCWKTHLADKSEQQQPSSEHKAGASVENLSNA